MIERLKESGGAAFGFKAVGRISAEEVKAFEPQIEFFIAERKKHPVGILADFTEMQGAEWQSAWEEMRFLQKFSNHIARLAVVGAHKWEEIVTLVVTGAAVLQSETRYFESPEIQHAWHWARTSRHADNAPVRVISPATGIWKDYHPEYTDI